MDLETLIAQWSGTVPPGFVRPAILETGLATCCHRRCKNKVATKKKGEPATACERCREDHDIERAQKRQDAIDATATDEFAARTDRPKPEPSAAYWSRLPDPEPVEEREWARSIPTPAGGTGAADSSPAVEARRRRSSRLDRPDAVCGSLRRGADRQGRQGPVGAADPLRAATRIILPDSVVVTTSGKANP